MSRTFTKFLNAVLPQTAPRWFGHGSQYISHMELQLCRGIKNTGGKSRKSHYTCGSLYPIGVGILLL